MQPFQSNASVNTFQLKRTRSQKQKSDVFEVVRAEELSWRKLSRPVQSREVKWLVGEWESSAMKAEKS
jgi:hypothetical protein